MTGGLQGRTNEIFPAKWLSLTSPNDATNSTSPCELVEAALEAQTVIDITSSPALWGGHMRGTKSTLMAIGSSDIERAQDEQQAHDLVQAHLIEILSAIGREHLDFYFLRLRRPLQEFQISGALIALEACRQEGNVRFSGIAAEDSISALGLLQFHDAFEAVILDQSVGAPVKLLARSRRMSVITRTDDLNFEPEQGQAALISVSSQNDVQAAMRSTAITP